jgi:hypothetical protein
MRAILTLLMLTTTLAAAPGLAADPEPTFPSRLTVYLDGPADLARLRQANPDHYARAERVLAAANQLCRPGRARLLNIAGVGEPSCADELFTSNPPKRQITFRLDDIRYVALVTITDDPPRLMGARQRP